LQTAPSFINSVTITHPTQAQLTLLAGTVPSLANISDINLNTIGGGGGTISQYIRAAYDATFGYYISINPNGDFLSNGSRNVFPNNMLIGGTSGTSRLNIGDGAMDAALYGSVQITQTDVTNTKAAISFVRNGHFVHGMGYLTGTSTFGFGAASLSTFNPSYLSITNTGNIGIGTNTPAYSLDVNVAGVPQFAVREGFVGGFRTQWNYSGGQGETTIFDYKGGGPGGFWFKVLDTGNSDVGWAPINCGYTTITNNGETLVLKGTDHTFIRFNYNNTNRGFIGYSYVNSPTLTFQNSISGGSMSFGVAGGGFIYSDNDHFFTTGRIVIGSSLSLGANPSTTTYTFRFPASMGTAGQVLTTDGTNTYWSTSGGGGGGGSVNSVTASAPLASTGGTAPNISIASATGSGAVVLNNSPVFATQIFVDSGSSTGFMKLTSVAGANYIQSGLINSGGSAAPLLFTDINANNAWATLTGTALTLISDTGGTLQFYDSNFGIYGRKPFGAPPGAFDDNLSYYAYSGHNWFGGNAILSSQVRLMTLNAAGNLGIGTSTPSSKLSVIGSGGFYSATNVGINFSNAAPRSFTIGIRGDTSNVFAITDDTAAAFRMVINTSGNVGFGTATPTEKLHLVGNSLFQQAAINQDVLMKFSVTNNLSGTVTYINTMYTAASNGNFVIETTGGYRDVIISSQALYLQNAALGTGAGVLAFWDGNHAIYGRYNQFGADVSSMNYHSYGDHVWWNNGLRPAQTQKMRLDTQGRLATLGFSTNNFTDVLTYERTSGTLYFAAIDGTTSPPGNPAAGYEELYVIGTTYPGKPWGFPVFVIGNTNYWLTRIGNQVTLDLYWSASANVSFSSGTAPNFAMGIPCPSSYFPGLTFAGWTLAAYPTEFENVTMPYSYRVQRFADPITGQFVMGVRAFANAFGIFGNTINWPSPTRYYSGRVSIVYTII
jgi:hypothetical protein